MQARLQRILHLKKEAINYLEQYMADSVPLFCSKPPCHLTTIMLEQQLNASKTGSVEYTTCIYLYPGHKGDNVSLLTGQYVLIDRVSTKENISGFINIRHTFTEPEYIYGAPSYLDAIKHMIPDALITFTPTNQTVGVLKVSKLK
jgi:hypothetical protein